MYRILKRMNGILSFKPKKFQLNKDFKCVVLKLHKSTNESNPKNILQLLFITA